MKRIFITTILMLFTLLIFAQVTVTNKMVIVHRSWGDYVINAKGRSVKINNQDSISVGDRIFYVDATNGNDSNDGLTDSTAFKTLAKVSATSLIPGDIVAAKRGEVWRGETLTAAWSGTSSNKIIISSYGSGSKPVLNGAEIITNWTNTGGSPSDSVISYSAPTLSNTVNTTYYSIRTGIISDSLRINGDSIRIAVIGGTGGTNLDGTSIGEAVYTTGLTDDFANPPVRITWDNGIDTVDIPQGVVKYSDRVAIPIDTTKNYLVNFWMRQPDNYMYKSAAVPAWRSTGSGDSTMIQNVTFTSSTSYRMLKYFEVKSADESTDIWVTPSPAEDYKAYQMAVIIDDNRFMPVSSLSALDADLEYFVEDSVGTVGDSIYVYSVINPALRTAELSTATAGIRIDAPYHDITIKNLDFRYYGYSGISARFYNPNANLLVDNCNFYFNRQAAVQFYQDFNKAIVQNCTATYNGNGFYANLSDSISFINNTVNNSIRYAISGQMTDGHGIGAYQAENILIEGNYMYENEGSNIGYSTMADSTTGNSGVIRYNTFKAYSGGNVATLSANRVKPNSTLDIYNNVIISDQTNNYALSFNNDNGGKINVYNNTLVQSAAVNYAIRFNYADSITFKNNILFNTSTGATDGLMWIYYSGTPISDNNIWYDENSVTQFAQRPSVINYTTLAAWQAASSQDANSLTSDPLFTTEFTNLQLQTGSPGINNGVNVGLTTDILGNPKVTEDMGAYYKQ